MATPLASKVVSGALGGLAATVAMTGVMYAAKRLHALGEPPPRKITRAFLHRLAIRPRRSALDKASLVAHAGFGMSMGAFYGALESQAPDGARTPPAVALGGAAYGLLVWAANYAVAIPKLGIMPRPLFDRPGRPTAMVLAHLVYGVVLAELVTDPKPADQG